MFRRRSKSLDRAKASSHDSLHVLETVDKQEQEARIAEYEALIDTLTQKISSLEQQGVSLDQQYRDKGSLQEQALTTLEAKLQQMQNQLQNAEALNEQHERNSAILQSLEHKVMEFKSKDDLKEKTITTLENRVKALSGQLENKQHQLAKEDVLLHKNDQNLIALQEMEKKVRYLSTELEGTRSQLQNQKDLANSRLRNSAVQPNQIITDPQTLLDARKLLKEVSPEFPKLTQETQHLFLYEARQFAENYMQQWSNQELQKDVFLTLLGAAHPEKKNTLQRLKIEASSPDSFLVAIAAHYGDKTNYLVDEESFNAKAAMGSFLVSKDYGGWIDHLRALSDRYLAHLSELEKERAVLKVFVKHVAPTNTHDECFTELGQANAEDLDTPPKIRAFLGKLKTIADIKALLANRSKIAGVRAIDASPATIQPARLCYNCGSDGHFAATCPTTNQGYTPLAQRSEQDRRRYLEAYDWSRWLCPQRRLDQRCNAIQECSRKKFRHLLTNAENKQRALGRLPLPGNPCPSAAEALAEDDDGEI